MARNPCQTVPCQISTVVRGKPTSTTRRVYKDNFCPNTPFSKTFCGSDKEHIFDKTASKHNFCDDNLAPRTNQPPTTLHGSRRAARKKQPTCHENRFSNPRSAKNVARTCQERRRDAPKRRRGRAEARRTGAKDVSRAYPPQSQQAYQPTAPPTDRPNGLATNQHDDPPNPRTHRRNNLLTERSWPGGMREAIESGHPTSAVLE